MGYEVKITPYAISQIQDTMAYISHELGSPETAVGWVNYLQKEISALDTFPKRFPLIEPEPWKTKGIRKMVVKNFIIYYLVDDEHKTVWVTAVIYGKRNQIERLKEMPF